MSNIPERITIDIEVTNMCNAVCYFCPRHATPHEGLMDVKTFDMALQRAVEYRTMVHEFSDREVVVSLCGLGEPLLNKNIVSFVEKVKAAGFRCFISSNGAPMTEKKAHQLLDAGLDEIYFNVSDINEEYEKVYNLPFARTRDNIVRFAKLAEGRCIPVIVLVDHHKSTEHLDAMKSFWRERGLTGFYSFDVINRGGALFVDDMQFEQYREMAVAREMLSKDGGKPVCGVPWIFLFIGYDGNHYLCCSDWRKQGSFGNIFDSNFLEVTRRKLEMVTTRSPVCKSCNHDPINRLTQELRALTEGNSSQKEVDDLTIALREDSAEVYGRAMELLDYEESLSVAE